MKRRVAVLLLAVVAGVGLYVGPARATNVLVVDNDTVKAKCRFGRADFHTIQAAVTAARPGGRIKVCPGEYVEIVVVDKQLTIQGAKAGLDARWRNQDKGESIIRLEDPEDPAFKDAAKGLVQLGADGIVWDGFLIADNLLGPGMFTSEKFSGYDIRNTVFNDNGLGLHLNSSGVREAKVRTNLFHANNEFEEPGAGTGIYSNLGARCIQIADNRFEDHNEAGILFADSGRTQQCVWVERNKSVDDNTFAAFYASSHVRLVANTVRSNRPGSDTDPPAAIFIGARNNDVVVAHNHIKSTHGTGIGVRNTTASSLPPASSEKVEIRKNKIHNVKVNGIEIAAPGGRHYVVKGNLSTQNGGVGIHVESTTGALLAHNTALDNGLLDCQDLTTNGAGTAGTHNTWLGNVGEDNNPTGICDPHRRVHKPGRHGHGKHHGHDKDKKQHHPQPRFCLPWRNKPY
jgi:nitrous oxidase accessory protein NosD